MKTVEELRKSGYKVRVTHYRYVNSTPRLLLPNFAIKLNNAQDLLNARGGRTVVEVTTPNRVTYTGVADCSEKEIFNNKEGVRVALERAYSELRKNTFLDKAEVIASLLNKGGKFFSVEFKKRTDGTIRRMNARFVKKSVIDNTRNLVTLWDVKKKSFRSVPLDAVIEVK